MRPTLLRSSMVCQCFLLFLLAGCLRHDPPAMHLVDGSLPDSGKPDEGAESGGEGEGAEGEGEGAEGEGEGAEGGGEGGEGEGDGSEGEGEGDVGEGEGDGG
ncbi:MAG: hypothetical protein RBU45_25805, partial [Myxococcota bacterium]|nr:hypothetical protein [Myxococcota bacterium]